MARNAEHRPWTKSAFLSLAVSLPWLETGLTLSISGRCAVFVLDKIIAITEGGFAVLNVTLEKPRIIFALRKRGRAGAVYASDTSGGEGVRA